MEYIIFLTSTRTEKRIYRVIVFYTDEMIPNYCRILNYIEDAKRDFEQKYENEIENHIIQLCLCVM